MKWIIKAMEQGWIPDWLIRFGIRHLDRMRLEQEGKGGLFRQLEAKRKFIQELRSLPIAVETDKANEQHYELPPEFFISVLGPHLKYSCCLWEENTRTLDQAEAAALELVARRAEIRDGMEILDLGCGWGSLSMWLAKQFPTCRIVSVSNSSPQRQFIQNRCKELGLTNVLVITADANQFQPDQSFDRVVSIEMFEHMRNYQQLLARISSWLRDDGKLFVHIFTHRRYVYFFETEGEDNWLGRYFFTGGLMPSDDLLLYFQEHLVLEDHWQLSGVHYQKTAEQWLINMDRSRSQIIPVFESVYGSQEAKIWFQRWRIFFMACAELWGYRNGTEWFVSHYLFRKR
ncbi:MAG: class I SAM-dependent methyltransferase [Sedimentisphaerales bacterium]|nr:class I SAM-dependent methyltransferase [Sedimentisphaerales bacterium]